MTLEAGKEMDRRCVWNWLNDVYRNPTVAFDTYSDGQQIEFAHDALVLLKEQPEIVRCKDCKHRPKEPNWKTYADGSDIEFPEGSKCPCKCSGDEYYSWYPEDDWFCADGERRDDG